MRRRVVLGMLAGVCGARGASGEEVLTQRGVIYSTAGGERLGLDIWRARQPGLRPVVLCIHGGAWRGGKRGDMGVFAEELAVAGYTAVTVSYRLFDPEKRPGNVWPAAFVDVQRAVRWLRANAEGLSIDPERITALGASAGGHLAALLGTCETREEEGAVPLGRYASRVNAVIDVFGPTDLTRDFSGLRLGAESVQDVVDDFIGRGKSEERRAADKAEASPLRRIDGKTVPFLVFHGAKDPIVPVEQGRLLEAALRKAGRDCRYVEWANEGHGLGAAGTMESFRRETMAFLGRVAGVGK